MNLSQFEPKSPLTQHGILQLRKIDAKEKGEHIYAIKTSPDGKYFAATYGNGCCRIYSTETNEPLQRAKLGPQHDDIPSTSVKFIGNGPNEEGEYLFASSSSGGAVYGWSYNPTAGAASFIDRRFRFLEDGNDTASIDVSPNAKHLVSGGSDRTLRLYDLETNKMVAEMNKGTDDGGHSRPAHTNRIFSVKFASDTTLLSAGWENPVQVWDLRTNKAERQLGGPQVSSDAIEILTDQHSRCIIASSRNSKQLQVFDFIGAREIERESELLSANLGRMSMTSVRHDRDSKSLWAIAAKPDVLVNIDMTTGEVRGMIEFDAPVYALDCNAALPKTALVGGMKENLSVVKVLPSE